MQRVEVMHQGAGEVAGQVEQRLERVLERLEGRIHRTTVWLKDANGPKGGAEDKECMVKVDVRGAPLVMVHARAATFEDAAAEALDRVRQAVLRVLGARRSARRQARSDRHPRGTATARLREWRRAAPNAPMDAAALEP
jgi:hypothetical protein